MRHAWDAAAVLQVLWSWCHSTSSRAVVSRYTPERQQWLVPQLLAHPQLICCDSLLEASLQIQKATMHALSKLQVNWPRAKQKKTGSRRETEEGAEQG
jgi:hypothetical protein